MLISVIGCGYLGAVHAAAMAHAGHRVVGIDVDEAKIRQLAAGVAPFFEPGLSEILRVAVSNGRLLFSTDMADVHGARVHFVAVGTPQQIGRQAADLRYLDAAISSLLPQLSKGDLVVGKSTVPVGTAARLAERIEAVGARLVWNPEFLREGFAVRDTLMPDRLVYGVRCGMAAGTDSDSSDTASRSTQSAEREVGEVRVLNQVYRAAIEAGTPVIVTDFATAELVKVAANAFLATKISFINAMAEIAEETGADVAQLADAIGYDERIGRKFLNAGVGFGGGCLPKDIRAFAARAEELGRADSVAFLKEVDIINLRRRQRVVDLALDALGKDLVGKRIAVLGLSFKPQSDDVRDSPALDVAVQLHGRGVNVVATDPEAIENARARHPQLSYSPSIDTALQSAEAVLLLTEWPEFQALDPVRVATLVRNRVIIDGRNCLDPVVWRTAGWTYRGLGRR